MAAPKVQFTVKATPVGGVGSGQLSYEYDYEGLLVSYGHYRLPSGAWSGGGPLLVRKIHLQNNGIRVHKFKDGGIENTFTMCGVLPTGQTYYPTFPTWTKAQNDDTLLDAAGHALRGYNRAKPGKAVADLGVFLSEGFNDGPPKLPLTEGLFGALLKGMPLGRIPGYLADRVKEVLTNPKAAGKGYLGVEFGWKPLVRDIQKLYGLWHTIDRRIADLIRNNGKGVRRRVTLQDDVTTNQVSTVYPYAPINVIGAPTTKPGVTVHTVTTTTETKIWWAGKFVYWIPDTSSSLWGLKARAALFGALPTPGVLYAAMPWSWLADWFTDIGEIADAISPTAVDNLVLKYGYTMKYTKVTTLSQSDVSIPRVNAPPFYVWEALNHSFSSRKTEETKVRTSGINPFGPGVNPSDFSPKQIAILAALGLAKS